MIATTSTKITYQGNGLTTEFAIPFAYIEAGQIKVIITDPEDIETELETDYFVDTDKNAVIYPGYPPGQEPALSEQPEILPSGWKLTIHRYTEATQLEDIGDKYPLPVIEKMVDKNTQLIQELKEGVERSVKVGISADITPDKLLDEIYDKAAIARSSAAAAAVSENNARASEQAAAQSETNAESYKDTTYGYMTTTEAYVSQAETSATTATNKATEASASASAAAQSKTAAEAAADTAYDYMIEAGASESIATQKATNAATSATAAATSEANARTLVNTVNPPWNIRMASTTYTAGDIAYSALLPSWARLEAVNNGTTGTGELPVTGITLEAGQYIADGTVKWIIDDVRDGDRVGDVVLHSALLPCHILADGATLADVSTEYPRLLATVIAENMVTSDSTDMGKYYYDSEADTLRVPKADDGRFIEGSTTAGTAKSAGLPNIKGTVVRNNFWGRPSPSGAFFLGTNWSKSWENGSGSDIHDLGFDASRCSDVYKDDVTTVQPQSLTSIAQIKY